MFLTSSSIQAAATSIALEVLRFLMRRQELKILKVSFTCNVISQGFG
jgi:hypothetical protein